MSHHYDSYYEELAKENRRLEKLAQSRCSHPKWQLIEVTREGIPVKTMCTRCKLINTVTTK